MLSLIGLNGVHCSAIHSEIIKKGAFTSHVTVCLFHKRERVLLVGKNISRLVLYFSLVFFCLYLSNNISREVMYLNSDHFK